VLVLVQGSQREGQICITPSATDEVEDMEAELKNDDDLHEDARAFFSIDLDDQQQPINLDGDGDDDGGVTASTDTRGTSTTGTGKRKSIV